MSDTAADVRVTAQKTFSSHMAHLAAGRGTDWVNLFTEDAVLEFPYAPTGYPSRVVGRDDLLAHQEGFSKTFRVEFTELHYYETVDPSLVIAQLKCTGLALATGRPYNQTYLSVVETRDGLISRYVDFWNPQVVMDAVA
ncbi:nuclear transport factor 2 family protein [Micromonospora sp. NBS 11-29]|uniref:nuclear transport factor 2 family protein n=1 Tax=Micromonospora sp. NBS 11-29 TaxID=1960879 RepID=UPI000B7829BA|nr:nuclear transport factor 2 family protein [Micromonospora sp. NBS 11-29]